MTPANLEYLLTRISSADYEQQKTLATRCLSRARAENHRRGILFWEAFLARLLLQGRPLTRGNR